jgi:hypothetical protein
MKTKRLIPDLAFEIVMRRRRSFTGKERRRFWLKEYCNISMSKRFRATPHVELISSRNRFQM